jgi:DNA-binding transcriptional MocR family regulator
VLAGGLHLWVELPPGADDATVAAAAREHGVAVDAGRRFFPAEPSGACLRLGFAAAADTADLAEGAHRLAAVAQHA